MLQQVGICVVVGSGKKASKSLVVKGVEKCWAAIGMKIAKKVAKPR